MKKIITLLFILFSVSANAQFVLTPKGFVDSKDTNNNYYIINFEGKSKQQLYNELLASIGRKFVSPKDVVSKIEGEQISLNCIVSNCIFASSLFRFDLNTTIVFEFKDNKIKINAPSVNSIKDGDHNMYICNKVSFIIREYSIFNTNGKLKLEKAKENLELIENGLIYSIISEIGKKSNW